MSQHERKQQKKKKKKKKKKTPFFSLGLFLFVFQSGTFPRSFVRNPDDGSQLVSPKIVGGSSLNGNKSDGASLELLRSELAEVKKQLAAETSLNAELKKSKSALEGIIASSGKGGAVADSSALEELKKDLERKKAEIADLTAKKNKYKKHAKAADTKLKGIFKKKKKEEGKGKIERKWEGGKN